MSLDNETLKLLKGGVQRFIQSVLIPNEDIVESTDDVPQEIIEQMKSIGLFGLSIPQQYGGLGLSMEEEVELAFDLGRTSLAYRSVFGTNIGIGSQGIVIDGTEDQKTKYLPAIASGEMIFSFALTEPEAGSDAGSIRTTAVLDGDHYVLNGTKRYITNAPRASGFTVLAQTVEGDKRVGISAFIVEAATQGITLGSPNKKMGQRGTKTCDVIFENTRVPVENVIGGTSGRGFQTAMKVLNRGRIHIAALAVGMANRLIQESVTYARDRRQFGQPISEFQLIQAMLADSKTEAYAAECMVRDAAKKYDRNDPNVRLYSACCKLFASESVGKIADRAVQIFGGAGYMSDYKVERFYRDVRLLRIYEGTSQIQQISIAKLMLA